MAEFLILLLLPGVVAFAASMDLFTMTIPNRVSIVMALTFFPAAWFAGLEWLAIADHLAAGLLVLAVGVGLFAMGWFGGGDAKLLAAISLWIGMENLSVYFIYVALAGGVLALAFAAFRMFPLPRQLLGEQWALRLHRPGGGIPYGIALSAAALIVYPQTVWFASIAH